MKLLPPSFRGRAVHDEDAARQASLVSGPFRARPRTLLAPADGEDLARLVRWAGDEGLSLVPRGGGTGMPGGNLGGPLVVDMTEGFDRIQVMADGESVRVGAGSVAAMVEAAVRAKGRRLPFLPASAPWATLGGIAANNSAGAGSFLHGAAADWVTGLAGVDASGTPFRTGSLGPDEGDLPGRIRSLLRDPRLEALPRDPEGIPTGWPRVRKNSSGYALDRFLPSGDPCTLLVGSEGTLALLTEIELRTAPIPDVRSVLLLGTPSPEAVVAGALGAAELGASACELLGRRFLEISGLVDRAPTDDVARNAFALLLIEVEGTREEVDARLDAAEELARRLGGGYLRADSEARAEALWELRRAASPMIARQAGRGLISTQFIEDSVVPVPELGRYLVELDRILARADFDAVVFGHAGDGNIHVNPLVDVESPDWELRVRNVLDEVVALVAELGGTLTGEHGDGRLRAPFLSRIWGLELAGAFARVKEWVDPRNLLNPGVVVPVPGQDPLEGFEPRPRAHPPGHT